MAYSTEADMIKALPEETIKELTDDEQEDEIHSPFVVEAIDKADGEIDAYLVNRYTTPLAVPIPAIIRGLSVDISIYYLYKRRVEEIPETRLVSYRDAVRTLRDIRDGKMPLPVTEDDEETASDISFGAVKSSHFYNEPTTGS
ncbi:MAG: DUF1320 domain-containing protein [Deltaproteobacteria bacterium]|nr:DUF1320 domain-containing protein [Deltaproteobacteria bacterium]